MKTLRTHLLIISVLIYFGLTPLTHAAIYNLTLFGAPINGYSNALGINNSGQVVGYSSGENSITLNAFLWDQTGMKILAGGNCGVASKINDNGHIVGISSTDNCQTMNATLWHGDNVTILGGLGGKNTQAVGLNNHGQIIGFSTIKSSENPIAVHWNNGVEPTILGTDGNGFSVAHAINDHGIIVGQSALPLAWVNNIPAPLAMPVNGYFGYASDINNSNQIAGTVYTTTLGVNSARAAFWENSTRWDLDTLGGSYSTATGVNNLGQVIGVSTTASNELHAFLWNDGILTDLNSFLDAAYLLEGWTLKEAIDINDNGWIVGGAYNHLTGQERGFLLSKYDVPEPSSLALLGLAGVLLSLTKRRRIGATKGEPRHNQESWAD